MYVWDTNTGELVTGKQYSEAATFGEWTAIKMSGRRPVYQVRLLPTLSKQKMGGERARDGRHCVEGHRNDRKTIFLRESLVAN